jgi:hypothetical protein
MADLGQAGPDGLHHPGGGLGGTAAILAFVAVRGEGPGLIIGDLSLGEQSILLSIASIAGFSISNRLFLWWWRQSMQGMERLVVGVEGLARS